MKHFSNYFDSTAQVKEKLVPANSSKKIIGETGYKFLGPNIQYPPYLLEAQT